MRRPVRTPSTGKRHWKLSAGTVNCSGKFWKRSWKNVRNSLRRWKRQSPNRIPERLGEPLTPSLETCERSRRTKRWTKRELWKASPGTRSSPKLPSRLKRFDGRPIWFTGPFGSFRRSNLQDVLEEPRVGTAHRKNHSLAGGACPTDRLTHDDAHRAEVNYCRHRRAH